MLDGLTKYMGQKSPVQACDLLRGFAFQPPCFEKKGHLLEMWGSGWFPTPQKRVSVYGPLLELCLFVDEYISTYYIYVYIYIYFVGFTTDDTKFILTKIIIIICRDRSYPHVGPFGVTRRITR